jgi:nicotinate-nucleotide adenylyltransferase
MIAILGGTFNPIHMGHLHMAKQFRDKIGFDSIRIIPAALPALKSAPSATADQRAEMVKLAINNQADLTLDTQELSRAGMSYTIDTLIALRQELGNQVSLSWLMGSDAFEKLNAWHRWQELLNYAHLVIAIRPHSEDLSKLNPDILKLLSCHEAKGIESIKKQTHGKILIQEVDALDISSTEIREKIANGDNVSGLLPKAVLDYIQTHYLYRPT